MLTDSGDQKIRQPQNFRKEIKASSPQLEIIKWCYEEISVQCWESQVIKIDLSYCDPI
jgi:hypothetical protein